jgi:hypothetical protein
VKNCILSLIADDATKGRRCFVPVVPRCSRLFLRRRRTLCSSGGRGGHHRGIPGHPVVRPGQRTCLLRFSRCSPIAVALWACRYRRGSADAARSRATDPAATRAEPTAILGLRRCTALAARRTLNTTSGASAAIASTVSRRGWRRRHGTPMTIPATGKTGSARRKYRASRRAPGVSVPAAAGAFVPSLRNRSFCCWMFSSTSAGVGASVPRPHATSPRPAAPAHSARARCRRPSAQCPAPAAAWVTTGATRDTHPSVREGLRPSRRSIRAHRSGGALLSSPAIPSLSPCGACVPIRAAGTRPVHLHEIAALDHRDFQVVTPRHLPKGQQLKLLPED